MKIFLLTLLALFRVSTQDDQAPAAPGSRVNGANWLEWEAWSGCSVTCDEGIKVRVRECSSGNNCPGTRLEIENCLANNKCPKWTDWTQWTACSSTCGYGAKERKRDCDTQSCPGPNRDFSQCEHFCSCPWTGWKPNQQITFNQWGEWQSWSQCSVSCGSGDRKRCRECAPSSVCTGPISESEPCNGPTCRAPVQWSEWGSWGSCSASCGAGTEERSRYCIGGDMRDCFGTNAEGRDCNSGPCQYSPRFQWGAWGYWGACSATCGGGTRQRQRQCNGGTPQDCGGLSSASETCGTVPCAPSPFTQPPIPSIPSIPSQPQPQPGRCPLVWQPWTGCLGGCNGIRTRQRTCGSCGGQCPANVNQFRPCNSGCFKAADNTVDPSQAVPTGYYPPRYAYVRYENGVGGSEPSGFGYQYQPYQQYYYPGYGAGGYGTGYNQGYLYPTANYQYLNYFRRRRR